MLARKLNYGASLLLLLLGGFCMPSAAAEELSSLPYVVGGLGIEVFSDHVFSADDPDDEVADTFAEVNLSFVALFSSEFYLETNLALLPVDEPDPGENRFFEDHGLALNTLALTWDKDFFWISAGKGQANFGIAQDDAGGIWGIDIPYDAYAINDRIGVAGTVNLATETMGSHAFYLGAFFLDTSSLSKTWITRTGPNRLEDGGPSNTESLRSFALAVDGAGIPALPDFRYHIAGLMQRTDRVNDEGGNPLPDNLVADEYRIAVAGEWSAIDLNETVSMSPLLEYVRFWNARGIRDDTEDFLTASLVFSRGQWNTTIAATGVRIDDGDVTRFLQTGLSFGYLFNNGMQLDAGYRYQRIAGESLHTIGLSFRYALPFAF